jgi:hypothetical protein
MIDAYSSFPISEAQKLESVSHYPVWHYSIAIVFPELVWMILSGIKIFDLQRNQNGRGVVR